MAEEKHGFLDTVSHLFMRNWLTLFGASLTTASALLILGLVGLELFIDFHSPYVGILAFMILPAVFVGGLLLIPLGAWMGRKKEGQSGYPKFDLNSPRVRRSALIILFLTGANLFIISLVTYEGVEFMDSVQFCGTVCHTVMEPEYTAYLNSPHARVKCVECHIGPGAPWFVKSKLSGVGQMFAVTLNTYEAPIPTPVENLRPSQDTCEQCHWPKKFLGDKVLVRTKYSEDEENTPMQTVLLLHLGGGGSQRHGIHSWHIDPARKTQYLAEGEGREKIALVRVTDEDGEVKDYWAEDTELDKEHIDPAELRTMDCIDCHNRPTHVFELPARAVDEAITRGEIARELPYVKQASVEALENIEVKEGDQERIAQHFRAFYQEELGDGYAAMESKIEDSIVTLQTIYGQNVFPKMEVTWGTYPRHVGHTDSPGCFRCHDDSHSTEGGDTISQDCSACHKVLAWDEEEPAIMEELGLL